MKYYLYHVTLTLQHTIVLYQKYVFSNRDELIYFLRYHQGQNYRKGVQYDNPYLDNLNMNGNDTTSLDSEYEKTYYLRPYLFEDENEKTIDVRNFIDEILQKHTSIHRFISYDYQMRWKNKRKRQNRKQHSKVHSWRHPHYKHLVMDEFDNEYKEYIRRKPVQKSKSIDFWELRQHKTCNWKDQSKRRHQWKPK